MARIRSLGGFFSSSARRALVVGMIALVTFTSVGLFFAFTYWLRLQDMPQSTLPELGGASAGIYIFDRQDHLISELQGDENRVPVPLKDVSSNMRKAMLAAEDHRFYSHNGIDFTGMVRALLVDVQALRPLEGGSTITQQLVKMLFFNKEPRTLARKVKVMIVAWNVEMRYSKDKILESYLNEVYFGSGAYGIERAADVYFKKKPSQLSLSESAFLAGLIKAPSELGSPKNRRQAIARQLEILNNMVEYGFIKRNQAEAAKNQALQFKEGGNALKYPYYVSYVVQLLKDKYGERDIWSQGLHVYTNMDQVAQQQAERTLAWRIKKAPRGVTQAALVSISVADGGVIALVGGVGDYWKHQWNRAVSPHTAGSAFKPFVYLAALINHVIGPDSIIDDYPITIQQPGAPDYSPRDFDDQFLGPCSVRKALALSRNICAVRVALATGIPKVIETAHKAGITSQLGDFLSLALGSSAISPLEMAGAYSTLARGGVAIQPQVIRRIDTWRGDTIARFDPKPERVLPAEPVAELVDAMQDVVESGTGTKARLADRPVAGKTGTADQAKDIWFVGFTPDVTTAIWGGNDDNLPIPGSHVTGGIVMAGFWHDYMQSYYKTHPTEPGAFAAPESPLMHESDFRSEPYNPIENVLENLFGRGGRDRPRSEPPRALEKPRGGVIRKMIRGFLNWL